jgi:molybdopterin synthase catalytic subunit
MLIELRDTPFDPFAELGKLSAQRGEIAGQYGANAIFIGTMRDFNEGDVVEAMFLEHYPGMTERELERLCKECTRDVEIVEMLVLHRVGHVTPGEHIVLVAVWTAHRAAAFSVCREVMEALKHRAPFWKKERLADGERWVAGNTPG